MIPRIGVSVLVVVVISTAWMLGSVVDADSYSEPPQSRRLHGSRREFHPSRNNEFLRSPLPHKESHPEAERVGFMRGPAPRFQEQGPYSSVQEADFDFPHRHPPPLPTRGPRRPYRDSSNFHPHHPPHQGHNLVHNYPGPERPRPHHHSKQNTHFHPQHPFQHQHQLHPQSLPPGPEFPVHGQGQRVKGHPPVHHPGHHTLNKPIVLKTSKLQGGEGDGQQFPHSRSPQAPYPMEMGYSGGQEQGLNLPRRELINYSPPKSLPPGPPVFFAPSPDVEMKMKKEQQGHQQVSSPSIQPHHAPPSSYYPVQYNHQYQGGFITPESSGDTGEVKENFVKRENFRGRRKVLKRRKKKHRLTNNNIKEQGTFPSWDNEAQRRPILRPSQYPRQLDQEGETRLLSRTRRSADRTPYIHFDTYKSGRSAERAYSGGENETGHHGLVSDSHSEEQRFFPSFPPYFPSFGENALRAAAPLFPAPHRAPSASRYLSSGGGGGGGGTFKFRGSPSTSASDRYVESNLLGSGNFEVVRGGTYYGDEDYNDYHDPYSNSHSPQGYRGGGGGGDFFANFRDFADINPHSRAYSEHSEVAVAGSHPKPKFSMEYVDPMEAND